MIRLIMEYFTRKTLGLRRYIQLDYHSCGKQAVKSVLNYFGEDIRGNIDDLGTTLRDGTDEYQIRRFFKNLGYKVRTVRSIKKLVKAVDRGWPVILYIADDDHWVVLKGYPANGVWITDSISWNPSFRYWGDFQEEWGGYGMEIYRKRR